MIDNLISRTKYKRSFDNFIQRVFFRKISANILTISGLCFGILSAFLIYVSSLYNDNAYILIAATILLVVSFFLDTVDGAVARMEGSTAFGGILDLFCDRAVEVSILIMIISTSNTLIWPGIFSLAAIILCITVFLAIGGAVNENELKNSKKVIYYAKGIMERGETFIFLLILILFPLIRYIVLWLFTFLVFLTALQRLVQGFKLFN